MLANIRQISCVNRRKQRTDLRELNNAAHKRDVLIRPHDNNAARLRVNPEVLVDVSVSCEVGATVCVDLFVVCEEYALSGRKGAG